MSVKKESPAAGIYIYIDIYLQYIIFSGSPLSDLCLQKEVIIIQRG